MCGIFIYVGEKLTPYTLYSAFMNTSLRGPDDNILKQINKNLTFGFHRLSIMDVSYKGNQPLYHPSKPYVIICNGEIYNYKQLKDENNFETFSDSDCEILLYMYDKYGIEETVKQIDSESFSFCLYDGYKNEIFIARDRFGVRPLFICKTENNEYILSSEMKSIHPIVSQTDKIEQFQPGSWANLKLDNFNNSQINYNEYFSYTFQEIHDNEKIICENIKNLLKKSIKKRMMSDRKIGCLLSGGLDSSIISALVADEMRKRGETLETFSIGIKGSTDIEYAKLVAEHIGSIHHSVELSEDEFLNAIPDVIYNIESYDTTTVRASTGNYLIGKYIRENTDIKVIFNGDGSDEQSGYIYLKKAPSPKEFKDECVKLLKEIHFYDVLRSDRSLSSRFSLETRTPFLDTDFVNYYMSIDTKLKMYDNRIEKYLLRKSFEGENLLPDSVLWRKKEAFSDGCSSVERSWHSIIKEFVDKFVTDDEFYKNKNNYTFNMPQLKETYFYRTLFESYYPSRSNIIPHYWLPNWDNKVDPSARELDIY